jgi:hypothetical protein
MSEIYEIEWAWHKMWQWMTFGGIFSEINLESIIDVIPSTNHIFLASKLTVPKLDTKIIMFAERNFREMTKSLQNNKMIWNLGEEKLCGSQYELLSIGSLTDTLNFRIVCCY